MGLINFSTSTETATQADDAFRGTVLSVTGVAGARFPLTIKRDSTLLLDFEDSDFSALEGSSKLIPKDLYQPKLNSKGVWSSDLKSFFLSNKVGATTKFQIKTDMTSNSELPIATIDAHIKSSDFFSRNKAPIHSQKFINLPISHTTTKTTNKFKEQLFDYTFLVTDSVNNSSGEGVQLSISSLNGDTVIESMLFIIFFTGF